MKKTYKDFLKPEEKLQARIISWIQDHPVLKHTFYFHYPAEKGRTPYEQFQWKVMGGKKNMPDLIFLEPNEEFTGLALEFKTKDPYTSGKCKYEGQEKELIRLRERGYLAEFQWDYDSAKKIICKYFDL